MPICNRSTPAVSSWQAYILTAGLIVASGIPATGQHIPADQAVPGAVVEYAPNPRYKAGFLSRWIFGTEYRNTWAIPIKLEVMDVGTYAGGLQPLKRGGFGQTTSLHMVDAGGVRHVFRSLDKDPARGLPDDLRHTFVGDVVRDQISSQHPYASLIVPDLLEAVGTLHVTPHLYVMPDDERLGDFRGEFAGLIGAIEERPDDGPDGEPGFAGADKVSSSSGMYDDLEKDARNRVDAVNFLQARLMDIYLGDRDRHFDQWRWARMDQEDGMRLWLPIPKDRDQAFKINDGLMMAFTRLYQRQYVSFGDEYPNIEGAAHNGRELDRRLLVNLERPVWDSVAADLKVRLTDEVIESAVSKLPPEIYAYHGATLTRQLKARRDDLPQMATDYYELLAEFVDLHSSDEDDIAEIDRNEDGSITVNVHTKSGLPYFHRTFHPSETQEVRVLTHGGEDSLTVRGNHSTSIKLRILPGGGDDTVVDQSDGPTTFVYDDRGDNRIVKGRGTRFDDARPHDRHPDEIFLPPAPEDDEARMAQSWGQYWYPRFVMSYSADFGFVAGAGAYLVKHAFRKQPFAYRWSFFAQGATAGRGLARTDVHFPDLSPKLMADIRGQFSSMELVKFYGFGNDFSLGDRSPKDDFFDVVHSEASASVSVTYQLAKDLSLTVGPEFRFVSVSSDQDNIVSESGLLGVADNLSLPGGSAILAFDTRDNLGAAAKGVHITAGTQVVPVVIGANDLFDAGAYTRIEGTVAVYLSPNNESSNPTLAVRVGGEKVFGDFPFYDAAFIGGGKNVRGYYQNRYAGEGAAFGNAELRLKLTRIRLIFPWEMGVHGLFDAGRVWLDDDGSPGQPALVGKALEDEVDPDKIHTAVGGGIWLSILKRTQTLSFSVAAGEDDTLFYVRAGFHF